MELDLTSMMNLIGILIPTLLVQTAFVEVAVINIMAPSIGGEASSDAPKPQGEPLNLRLGITHEGYRLTATPLAAPVSIPLTEKRVQCSPYLNTTPPPRPKNSELGLCKKQDEERTFWIYDTTALSKALADLKNGYPDERSIVIEGEPNTEYESMTNAMDASRGYKDETGTLKELFPEVIIGGGVDT